MKKQIRRTKAAVDDGLDLDGEKEPTFESRNNWSIVPYTGTEAVSSLWLLRLQLATAIAALAEVLKATEAAINNNPTPNRNNEQGKKAVEAMDDIEEQVFLAKDLYFDQGLFFRFGK